MKFDAIKNPNYVATVVRIEADSLYSVPGLDNLLGYSKFGMQALVSKDTAPGLYILFSTEVQLSEDFARANNLHREATLNADQNVTGYLEQNRRVKAIKLKGNRSDSLLMPLDSLSYLGPKGIFNEGDVFDSIDGQEICRKYLAKEPKENNGNQPKARVRRVDEKVFPQHIDSENYWRNEHKIPLDAHLIVTQKLHGTSVRYGHVPALIDESEQKWWEKLLRRPLRSEYRFIVGSRRTVKSLDLKPEDGKNNYYADGDLWTRYADENRLADRIPKDHIVYGELVGFTSKGSPIQKNYTYDLPDGEAALFVYRVAVVTAEGHVVDYSHDQMVQFCHERGLATVPELWRGLAADFNADSFIERRYYDEWKNVFDYFPECPVPLSHPKLVDEGVCVRLDGQHGVYVLKAKSPSFLEHETKMLDTGAEDLEAAA
jgi:hypothetical protein